MDRILELILVLAIIGSTLAFGGVEPLTYSIAEVVLFLCVLLLLLKQTREGNVRLPLPLWPVVFAFWVLVQVIPLPSRLIKVISPARFNDLELGSLLSGSRTLDTLSLGPHDTAIGWIKFLAYAGAFVLAAYLFDTGRRKSMLIRGLVLIGCFEAAYGIVQYLTGWQKIFSYTKQFDLEDATGTYINHNHFAGLLELTLPFVFALAFYSFQREGRRKQSGGSNSSSFQSVFYFVLAVVLMVALVFSRSRGGILASLLSLIFISLLAQLKFGRKAWVVGVSPVL